MAERLTEVGMFIDTPVYKIKNGKKGEAVDKLAKLEDILEKYGVEDLEQLDIMLFCLSSETKFQLKQLQKLYKKYKIKNVEELEKKIADSDTWQKACELACKHIAEVEWLSCPETDDISESENEIKTLTKQSLNYFYQQAKKEKGKE